MHVFVHEVENGQPQCSKCRQGQERSKVVKKHLGQDSSCPHACLLHASGVLWTDWIQQLGKQREKNFVETRLPFWCHQCLQIMNQQCSLEICDGTHSYLHKEVMFIQPRQCSTDSEIYVCCFKCVF